QLQSFNTANPNTLLDDKWSKWTNLKPRRFFHSNSWYQSKPERPLRKRMQHVFIKRQLKGEREARLGRCIKQITNDCKETLKRKMEEIELYNSTINQLKSHHTFRRHKCFNCIMKTCPMMKQKEENERIGKRSETAKENMEGLMASKPTVSIKYPESIHFETKCMLKRTDQGHWDNICLVYMFKDPKGQSFNKDRLRVMHNKYLEEYFEALDGSAEQNKTLSLISMQNDVIEIKGTLYSTKVTTFNEYVAFLNLVKQDEIISQEWDTFRGRFDKVLIWFYKNYLGKPIPGQIPPIINGVQIHLFDLYKLVEGLGGYLSVYFGQECGEIGEILGLTKQYGEEIKRCYINYLDIFISYYKTARVPNQYQRSNLQMMNGSDIRIQEKKAKLFNEWEREDCQQSEVSEQFAARIESTCYHRPSDQGLNYLQQPMPNPEDITYPTTAMNMALALMAKAFKLNYSTPTNNNQRISSNPRNRQYAGQNAENPTGYNDVIGNHVIQNAIGNGNLVAVRAEGNAAGQNENQIRCYNCRGVEEYDLMADAADLDEIKKVNANCILMANLQQASTSSTQTDSAPVYDSDGSSEVHNYENCYDNEIFNMFTQEEQYIELLEPIPESHQVPQNDNNVISQDTSVE
nr:ARID DNA-binding domain-containing protein [Tanacetum cinerariifolium]